MNRTSAAAAGVLALVVGIMAAELVVFLLPGGRPVFAAVGSAVIEATPGPVATWTVRVFRGAGRAVLFGSIGVTLLVVGVALGVAEARGRRAVTVAALVVLCGLGTLITVTDPFIPLLSAVLAPIAGGLAMFVVLRRTTGPRGWGTTDVPVEEAATVSPDGRQLSSGTQAPDTQAPGTPTSGTQAPGAQASGTQAPGAQASGTQAPGAQAPGTQAPSAQAPDRPARATPNADAAGRRRDPDEVWDRRRLLQRRRFLTVSLTTAAGAFAVVVAGRAAWDWVFPGPADVVLPTPPNPLRKPTSAMSFAIDELSPLITPMEDFYRIDTAVTIPRIDPENHTIQVIGMVDEPFAISYDELSELADTEVDVTLACVSNEVGGGLVGNARWFGVPLATLLDRAGVQPGADQVVGRAVDGWTAGFPLEVARDGRPAIVAIGMNGEPLPRRHGFPARLVIAGLYGYVSDTKWLSQIELTTFDAYDAYWIERGWDRFGPVRTQTRIDVPGSGPVPAGRRPIAGVAWAGERGISAVEVSIDGGSWRPARLAEALASSTWRQWMLDWDAAVGTHAIRARAVDGDGELQTSRVRPPEPSGATGYHEIRIQVT